MANPLRAEYLRARAQGWVPFFFRSAAAFDHDPAVLMGIASRESNMGGRELKPGVFQWLTKAGDGGHGFGIMQIDDKSFPEWTRTGQWRQAGAGIVKGAEVLAIKRARLIERAGKQISVRDRKSGDVYRFKMMKLEGALLERTAIAAYNSGDWAGYHVTKGRDPDRGTTLRNYSADVLDRAAHFRRWLVADAEREA